MQSNSRPCVEIGTGDMRAGYESRGLLYNVLCHGVPTTDPEGGGASADMSATQHRLTARYLVHYETCR